MMWLTGTHGPIARVWVGPVLVVLLADPKYIEVSQSTLRYVTGTDQSALEGGITPVYSPGFNNAF